MTRLRRLFVLVMCLAFLAPLRAQAPVTAADLARLDSVVANIRTQAATLKRTDATLAADVERSAGDLADEVAYLRVKLRREGVVPREEYASLRDRLETLRMRSLGQQVA